MTKEEYSEYLNYPEWKSTRSEILRRDNYTCIKCKKKKAIYLLHIHHLKYSGLPWEVNENDLVTVCKSCHYKIHNNEEDDFEDYDE